MWPMGDGPASSQAGLLVRSRAGAGLGDGLARAIEMALYMYKCSNQHMVLQQLPHPGSATSCSLWQEQPWGRPNSSTCLQIACFCLLPRLSCYTGLFRDFEFDSLFPRTSTLKFRSLPYLSLALHHLSGKDSVSAGSAGRMGSAAALAGVGGAQDCVREWGWPPSNCLSAQPPPSAFLPATCNLCGPPYECRGSPVAGRSGRRSVSGSQNTATAAAQLQPTPGTQHSR